MELVTHLWAFCYVSISDKTEWTVSGCHITKTSTEDCPTTVKLYLLAMYALFHCKSNFLSNIFWHILMIILNYG